MSVQLDEGVLLADADDGAVLLDERTGRYWQLNCRGARVLRTLLAGQTLQRAAAELIATYPVDAERADADAGALLERLRRMGLVRE